MVVALIATRFVALIVALIVSLAVARVVALIVALAVTVLVALGRVDRGGGARQRSRVRRGRHRWSLVIAACSRGGAGEEAQQHRQGTECQDTCCSSPYPGSTRHVAVMPPPESNRGERITNVAP